MGKYIFEAFSEYNKKVNANMNKIIEKLSEEEWNKSFPAYYKSVHELCSHIYISDYTWLNRFCEFCEFTELKDLLSDYNVLNYNWGNKMFENINEYLLKREELDEEINNFVHNVKDEQLSQIMPIDANGKITWEGNISKNQLGIYLIHIFNHATHHRAQISIYLEMLGKENEYSDLW
jgi:uncharacterized damage-inducible protein DinB